MKPKFNSLSLKTLFHKGFLVFLAAILLSGCGVPRHSVEIQDYVLVENGKQVLGNDKGLTAFIFENNPRKITFAQFASEKYNLGTYTDLEYWVNYEGYRFKIFVYSTDELNKYFDMGQFMVTKEELDVNVVGSKEKFIGLSMISESNEDVLDEHSLFNKVALKYLTSLKEEYNNL